MLCRVEPRLHRLRRRSEYLHRRCVANMLSNVGGILTLGGVRQGTGWFLVDVVVAIVVADVVFCILYVHLVIFEFILRLCLLRRKQNRVIYTVFCQVQDPPILRLVIDSRNDFLELCARYLLSGASLGTSDDRLDLPH